MCACRCGIKVHLQGRAHPLHRGQPRPPGQPRRAVRQGLGRDHAALLAGAADASRCCGSASAARASSARSSGRRRWRPPPSGSARIRATDPKRLAFFTGRDQSQALTGWWASQFGTPNYAAHGGFCSVNMAAAGLYTIGGSFWEFGEPDWERTPLLHAVRRRRGPRQQPDQDRARQAQGARGVKIVSVNPVRTGYSAIADEWLGITPGTDGLFVLALIHELLRAGKVDLDYLVRYTNAAWLVIDEPGAADDGLFARDGDGRALVWDAAAEAARARPAIRAMHGRRSRARSRCAGRPPRAPGLPPAGRALSRSGLRARCGGRALTACRPPRSAASPPSSPQAAFDRPAGASSSPGPTAAGRRHERMVGRPVGDARDARHLGARQRLPHLPRAASAADPARHDRCAGRLPLQAALPQARSRRRRSRAGRPGEVVAGPAAARPAARLPDRPRGPAGRGRRQPVADRQGVLLGSAARRPRPDAHGDHQRLRRRSLPDRHAVHVHGQHGLELGDEHGEHDRHADRQGPGDAASTASRTSSTRTPTSPRWWPTPTSCCPTPPTSSAGTASRCSTGRSARPTAPATRSASRCWRPIATCGRSRTCCSTSAIASACPA